MSILDRTETGPNRRMEDQKYMNDWLAETGCTNDRAVQEWQSIEGKENRVEALLNQAMYQANAISHSLLHSSKTVHRCTVCATKKVPRIPNPVSVVVPTCTETLTFHKAFLISDMIRADDSLLDSATIASAVIFYNAGLFFHLQLESSKVMEASMVSNYYLAANRLLATYMETTRRPLWSLQAAIWHNVSECCVRFQSQRLTAFSVFFGQLEAIIGYVSDQEDRAFFNGLSWSRDLKFGTTTPTHHILLRNVKEDPIMVHNTIVSPRSSLGRNGLILLRNLRH